ncbi:hypothetical protein HYH02_007889 [Chlamydomonas schloesseri]|uniref:C2 domain-containing protein n=1 Tax=Chlamydomonas schloesseri TaxID=2026947 RepID=A0A836B4G8_9CHLO|nr:hypothetical protein HYH02_007889 [Chlamydomonas schloesseri]|eukprot:KAG2447143.1 hypothetical protein HYH02_007889 [Chlamydomonas schloesseri]
MALDAGQLRVVLQYAKGLKDQDWFGRQDPYVRLRLGSQERRSRTHIDGGKNPVWEETFEFGIINENTLELILYDEDTLKKDDLIGTATVSLARARELGHEVVQAPVLTKHHKQKGFVQLTLSFTPNSRLRPGTAAAAAPAAYGYPVAPPPAYGYAQPPPAYTPAPSFYYPQPAAPAYPAPAAPPVPAYGYGYPPAAYHGSASYSYPPPAPAPQPVYQQSASYHYPPPAPAAYPGYGAPSAPAYGGYPAYGAPVYGKSG